MAKLLILMCAIVTLAACSGDTGAGPVIVPPPGPATVSMPADLFSPFTTTITVGATVNYDFPARAHNVIFDRVTGAPGDIQQTSNRIVARAFPSAGTFPYNCTLHPGMRGEVVVR